MVIRQELSLITQKLIIQHIGMTPQYLSIVQDNQVIVYPRLLVCHILLRMGLGDYTFKILVLIMVGQFQDSHYVFVIT